MRSADEHATVAEAVAILQCLRGRGEVATAAFAHIGFRQEAVEIALHDDVDDTGDRVRAIDGGGAVLEYLDALHGGGRNAVQVDGFARQAVVGNTATVDQDERVAGGQAPQGHGCRAVAAVGDGGAGGVADDRGHKTQQLAQCLCAAALDIGAGVHLDRRAEAVGIAADARACEPAAIHVGLFHAGFIDGQRNRRRRGAFAALLGAVTGIDGDDALVDQFPVELAFRQQSVEGVVPRQLADQRGCGQVPGEAVGKNNGGVALAAELDEGCGQRALAYVVVTNRLRRRRVLRPAERNGDRQPCRNDTLRDKTCRPGRGKHFPTLPDFWLQRTDNSREIMLTGDDGQARVRYILLRGFQQLH